MNSESEYGVANQFRRECSVRRTLEVLDVKHRRIEEDLQQFIQHLKLLVPAIELSPESQISELEILEEALGRLGDDAFADLVLRILERVY